MNKIIFVLILIGFFYRFLLTANGNFLFNMDNARDMVDVREMVVLGKLRLTGPTSAIEGFYNGPAWYYFLAIPFILSGGDPYVSIIMEIILWAVGGYFLVKLIARWSRWLILPIGTVWIFSDYIVLANLYAFNPNPVLLLSPLWIYLLVKYLEEKKAAYIIAAWFLGGLFFNFEMNFGIFVPLIIFSSLIFTGNTRLIKQKWFFIGVGAFIFTLLPQIIFDLRHDFLMSKAVLRHLYENYNTNGIFPHLQSLSQNFFSVLSATLFNAKILTFAIIIFGIIICLIKRRIKDFVVLVSMMVILIPFLGYIILPVTVNPWHLGAEAAAALILLAYILKNRILIPIAVFIILLGMINMVNSVKNVKNTNHDPSFYKNEIAAINYVYKYANGENFKVYTFMPSVYDYPYQYLFWWYGQNKYGYIPVDYAYSPNKPQYIPSQDKFQVQNINYSGLVFLIKEPDRNDTRSGWEGGFVNLKRIGSQMVGPLEIEIKRE